MGNYRIQTNMTSAKWNYSKKFYQSCLEDCQRQLAINAYDIEALTLMYMCEMDMGLVYSARTTLTLINKARSVNK
jgi:hypothetical protein